MQYIYSDSFGNAYSLTLPFDDRDDSGKQELAQQYRRFAVQASGGESFPALLPIAADVPEEELPEAA